ncbi:MAG: group I intron-associated PD-(D/E)XK endonuclease, partial [Terriglobales bacterium]
VESRSGLHRVQVKSTMFKRSGRYQCLCHWSRGGQGTPERAIKRYLPTQVDFVAAYVVPEDSWFIIPTSELRRKSLYLPTKNRTKPSPYDNYREAWRLLGAEEGGLNLEACAEVLMAVEQVAREQSVA